MAILSIFIEISMAAGAGRRVARCEPAGDVLGVEIAAGFLPMVIMKSELKGSRFHEISVKYVDAAVK